MARVRVVPERMTSANLWLGLNRQLDALDALCSMHRPMVEIERKAANVRMFARELEARHEQLQVPFGWVEEVPSDGRDHLRTA